jgi:signal transduction histidine kinase
MTEAADAAKIETVAMDSIKLTRALAKGLNPIPKNPDSLMIALKEMAANTEHMFPIKCTFECEEPVLIGNDVAAAHIYRLVQEAVTNAIRHGKAESIKLILTRNDDNITLTIKDNGVGLPNKLPPSIGIGFRTMKYRAESIQGSLTIDKNPTGGTIVSCVVPIRSIQ